MMQWIHYCLIAFETLGIIYFYNTFMDVKECKGRWLRYPILYALIVTICLSTAILFPYHGEIIKVLLVIVSLIAISVLFYQTTLVVSAFFSLLNYMLLFFVDCAAVSIFGMQETTPNHILWIGLRILWLVLLIIIRKKFHNIKKYLNENRIPWTRFAWLPLFSGIIGIYFYFFFLSRFEPTIFYSFISIGILILNIMSLVFLQDSLVKEEEIQLSKAQLQKKQDQIQVFHDMQSLYERQGRKLHDYKKQIGTIQELLKAGDVDAAIDYSEQLTKSIAVEASEINVGHPVINAVLNQQYRIAKGKDIGMTFAISDLNDIKLSDDDIVVMLGNLIENAIRECEKVTAQGRTASITVKFIEREGKIILNVRNPVSSKVEIVDNKVTKPSQEGHGIGLSNVESVAEKNGGRFAISCDENEFVAVVVI